MGARPLEGIRVLDFCWIWAGPLMTATLADLGAEVIKIESRRRLDGTRLGRPMVYQDILAGDEGRAPEVMPLNHGLNRGKRSVTIDLQMAEGREIVLRLARECDVVCENFRPGVLAKLGLDYERLRLERPEIVMLSLSGAGQSGPWRKLGTFAPTVCSLAGLSMMLGYEGEVPLGRVQAPYGDTTASLYGVLAILGALQKVRATGEGSYLDLSQWHAALSPMFEPVLIAQSSGESMISMGNRSRWLAPHNNYRCAGEDEWISIAVESDAQWQALVAVLGGRLAEESYRFPGRFERLKSIAEIDALVEEVVATRSAGELETSLRDAGVAAAAVKSVGDQFADPGLQERMNYQWVSHPVVGEELIYTHPWKIASMEMGIPRAAPVLGQDNEYVLRELLGYSTEELAALGDAGVLE